MEPNRAPLRLITMKPVAVTDSSLSQIAGRQSAAAGIVTERAVAERLDTAALTPTFGLIGAPFLAALGAAMNTRAARLDALAGSHTQQAAATVAAAAGYGSTDAANAAGVSA